MSPRQLAGKRPNRGFGCAGTETTRGTTDIAAYGSNFGVRLPIPMLEEGGEGIYPRLSAAYRGRVWSIV